GADVVLVEGGLSSFPLRGRADKQGLIRLGPISRAPAVITAQAEDFVGAPLLAVPDVLPEPPLRLALTRGGRLRGRVVDSRDIGIPGASVEVVGTDRFGLPIDVTPLTVGFRSSHFEWALTGPQSLIPAGELGVMPGPLPTAHPPPPATPLLQGLGTPNLAPGLPGAGLGAPFPAPDARAASASSDLVTRAASISSNPASWSSDVHGEFEARPIPPGSVRALVRHPEYVEGQSELVNVGPGASAEVRIVLLHGGTLEGFVKDARGFPVGGVQVRVQAQRGPFERSTFSASDGSFAFSAVPEDVILQALRPDAESRVVVRKSVTVRDGARERVELTLPEARDPIIITVQGPRDAALELVELRVSSLDPNNPLRSTLFTDANGRAQLADALGLPLRIAADAPGYARVEQTVDSAPAELSVRLSEGIALTGRITAVRGRQSVVSAVVTLIQGTQRKSTTSNGDGLFKFRDVAPGAIEIHVQHPDYAPGLLKAQATATGRSDRPLELDTIDLLEPGELEGTVEDARGQPVEGARVALGASPSVLPAGVIPEGIALTDAQGQFKLRRVAPGKAQLSAYAPNLGRGTLENVEVVAGRTAMGLRLRLTQAPTKDENGESSGVAILVSQRAADVVISEVARGSEAERAGLLIGDLVRAVDGVRPERAEQARERLAGRAGSDVLLELERQGQLLRLRVGREELRR
ncbi:MAG TPA: carboxypeptidase regulatory-like domain-containing protein, partial [Polyangiaceae bacterium]|nr:carboxypeptidase regulatory-like domain-containing protein [Polyangiaceae bacterium]